ncbi:MAG: hypothetical protein ACD_79C00287G0033 [uncultured bacterium]|nr:MAG: hypothetical protein ACD_79C00287G0033 [uncultured bacterium]
MKKNKYSKSEKMWELAQSKILNGVMTLSKSPLHIAPNTCPIYIKKAKGAYFWDVDGNRYIDYPLALGPVILGHAYSEVDTKVKKQISKGILYSLSSYLEIELAERLIEIIPSAEKVKLLKTGSDAMSAAVRIAKAFTGREKVAVCGYHGWHDWTIVRSTRNSGIPADLKKLIYEFQYNDLNSLKKIFDENPGQIAAVILEPVGMTAPVDNFLQNISKLANENEALMIFDEIITGFRLSLGGAQKYFSVTPDISAFGKAMANGYPISAVVGKKEIFDAVENKVFISSTYAGDLISISAAIATLKILEEKKVNDYILKLGEQLKNGLNSHIQKYKINATCEGLPHKTFLVFKENKGISGKIIETIFRQESFLRGMFLGYGHFMSYSHKESDIITTLKKAEEIFDKISRHLNNGDILKILKGPIATDVFKRY